MKDFFEEIREKQPEKFKAAVAAHVAAIPHVEQIFQKVPDMISQLFLAIEAESLLRAHTGHLCAAGCTARVVVHVLTTISSPEDGKANTAQEALKVRLAEIETLLSEYETELLNEAQKD